MRQKILSNLVSNSFYDDRPIRSVKSIDSTTGNWYDYYIIENNKYKLIKIDVDYASGSFQETYYRFYEKVKIFHFFKVWKEIKYIENEHFRDVFQENWYRLTKLNGEL